MQYKNKNIFEFLNGTLIYTLCHKNWKKYVFAHAYYYNLLSSRIIQQVSKSKDFFSLSNRTGWSIKIKRLLQQNLNFYIHQASKSKDFFNKIWIYTFHPSKEIKLILFMLPWMELARLRNNQASINIERFLQ